MNQQYVKKLIRLGANINRTEIKFVASLTLESFYMQNIRAFPVYCFCHSKNEIKRATETLAEIKHIFK